MSGRRRRCAASLAVVVVLVAGCGSTDTASPASTTTVTTTAVTTIAPSSSSPSTSSSSTSSPTTSTLAPTTSSTRSTTPAVGTIDGPIACPSLDIVVLGNSTDYWPDFVVGVDSPTDDAWPAVLETLLGDELPGTQVEVENGSVLGAGFDIGLYGVTSMRERLETLASSSDRAAVLIVAPSVVDLQLRSLDVDASFAAFEALLDEARAAFDTVRVLPMNPVASGFDPEVAAAVVEFNDRLVEAGTIARSAASPLLADDGIFGRPEYYDDFDDGRLDTPGPDPDGLHPDVDGHRRLAEAVARTVADDVASLCR